MEPVFRTLEFAVPAVVAMSGSRVSYEGLEHIPERGGAVVAINHTSYIDWIPAAMATYQRRRRLRFMIKEEMTHVPVVRWIIKQSGTIPVDRTAGAGAYAVAVERLRAGEIVGVYPEATISRSFELKEFKTGAVRMALEADVPILPMIVWGAHRRWTKDHPRKLGRARIPITVKIGEPLWPTGRVDDDNAKLREVMTAMLYEVQEAYDHPRGAFWVPRRLGGSAPTPEEAAALDQAELAERARKRALREARSR
ncbi:acyltransferase family protein [Mycolicibacterium hassiacum DSM 44199]|jgi:1-acyl-sn-glycerol-3-phosphate acyltransferase|uniref:Acyltransferase family protein n=1 Tax=Mycolicibacterium hassiacum (strain DSM 44199 / CIP 105218 / JCM 12690 / 3849) TaxID=1122247 RepID=K5BE21_MYCHD|nr:lysophospholipid acyltransferase family protein [Mycolicibacterium hassiacum]EKF21906.1 acyltransferase family protein [Mycolicibacterium hassiacum DSM 44199]MBX5488140.1 1-acyl-sn-glycerol-3-phosphate acyltransferase [Mycolicibacterium hassiacum]MDA4085379.1 acyltransferase [Mycolicibacterium hassiacum DSM 44199]PZN19130.1 MAG: 1-acyl-sn-glycerol-3-phosphate acyltransferase [Mycolicibacterium hassiacum]VCT92754.1 1-acyl-sn-glycerol-3-phosphate acyltransferase [Mycolicibacterium hassiacum D